MCAWGGLLIRKMSLDNRKKLYIHGCWGRGVQKNCGPAISIAYELGDYRICHLSSQSAFSSIKLEVKTLPYPPHMTCWRRSFYVKGKDLYKSNRPLSYSNGNIILFSPFECFKPFTSGDNSRYFFLAELMTCPVGQSGSDQIFRWITVAGGSSP